MLDRCPICGTYGERDFDRLRDNINKVVCDSCTRTNGRETPYCWICTQTWKGGGKGCGNANCQVENVKCFVIKLASAEYVERSCVQLCCQTLLLYTVIEF